MHHREPLDGIRKIAVVRANGIGDYCFTLPALAALRAAYPHAEIVWLGKSWLADFLLQRPGPIDRVVVIPTYGGVGAEPGTPENADDIERFFAEMRAEHFDLALQLHGGGRYSNPFTRRLNARITAGLRAADAAPLDRTIPHIYFQPEILRYLEVVALVGASPVTFEPSIAVTARDQYEIDRLGLVSDNSLAVLNLGATDPRRRWPTEHFAEVGRALAAASATIAVTGVKEDRLLVHAFQQHADYPVVDLCERLTLGGLAALLARACVLVSNDSGPLHLAAAVGSATVGIFWCGNLINGGPLTRRWHRPSISWRLDCSICGRNTLFDNCTHRASFVADVPVTEVTQAALDLWQDRRAARAIAA